LLALALLFVLLEAADADLLAAAVRLRDVRRPLEDAPAAQGQARDQAEGSG